MCGSLNLGTFLTDFLSGPELELEVDCFFNRVRLFLSGGSEFWMSAAWELEEQLEEFLNEF